MNKYQNYIQRKINEYEEKFSDENLNQLFVNAFNNGDNFRVLVDFGTYKKWGYISVTTGWKPCFLLMARRGIYGSSDTIDNNCKILKTRYL